MAFICMLHHMRLSVPRAVTLSVIACSVVSFTPACLASLGCSLACLLACLLDSSINSFIDDCGEFEIFTYTIFKRLYVFLYSYWSLVSVLILCILIDPLYWYYFPVLWSTIVVSTMLITWHAITWHLTPACYHLTPIWCYLSPATWNITTCLVIIICQESYLAIMYYKQWPIFLVLMYFCYS